MALVLTAVVLLLPKPYRALQIGPAQQQPSLADNSALDVAVKRSRVGEAATFAQDRFQAARDYYDYAMSIGSDLPRGHWQQNFTFTTIAALRPGGKLIDDLGFKKIFIIGDSWGREKYTTLVRLLANASGAVLTERKYTAPPGQLERRDLNEMRHAEPSKWDVPECKYEACPGIKLSKCGLPGGDNWTSPSGVSIHYRFKTYFRTEPADEALMSEISSMQPDIVFLDIGRWGPSPNACTQVNRTSFEELSSFLLALNATTKRPIFLWQSGGESHFLGGDRSISHAEPFEWIHFRQLINRCRFLEIPINRILNDDLLKTADCSTDPHHGWGQPMGPIEEHGNYSTSYCPVLHGFAGTFLDEVMKLSAKYVRTIVE